MEAPVLSHQDLYKQILELKSKNNYNPDALSTFVKCRFENIGNNYSIDNIKLRNKLKVLQTEFNKRWQNCCRKKELFEKKNASWLEKDLIIPLVNKLKGRPIINFADASDKTKRRKISALKKTSVEELSYATQVKLKENGQAEASRLLKEATTTTPTRASEILNSYKNVNTFTPVKKYSDEEALALIIDAKLTKSQYMLIRLQAKQKKC